MNKTINEIANEKYPYYSANRNDRIESYIQSYKDLCLPLIEALEELYETVPKQKVNIDWWDDSMTRAMEKAKQVISDTPK